MVVHHSSEIARRKAWGAAGVGAPKVDLGFDERVGRAREGLEEGGKGRATYGFFSPDPELDTHPTTMERAR
jgi:hypothetical protein